MKQATPSGVTPPAPGLEREEPELSNEEDIPRADDGAAAADEPEPPRQPSRQRE
jgi:hypothetical protein